jgi:hypothetical protein
MTFSEDDEEMNKEHLQMSNSIAKWMYEQVEVKKWLRYNV